MLRNRWSTSIGISGPLQLGIVDPHTRKPVVKLAIAGRNSEGWYPMGKIQIKNLTAEKDS